MRPFFALSLLLLATLSVQFLLPSTAFAATSMTREQALKTLKAPMTKKRLNAVIRLSEIGLMSDADALIKTLLDPKNGKREKDFAVRVAPWTCRFHGYGVE